MATKQKRELTEDELFEEYSRYRHQFTVMEKQEKSYAGNITLDNSQAKVLKKLYHENQILEDDLGIATSPIKMKEDRENMAMLTKMLTTFDHYTKGAQEDEKQISEIVDNIHALEKAIQKQRAVSYEMTDMAIQMRQLEVQKTVEKLENKLETQTKKFCTIMDENEKLRMEINHLLIERIRFNDVWEKLMKNLTYGKQFMLDLIEQATLAYDQREELCGKLQMLRVRAKNDLTLDIEETIRIKSLTNDRQKLHTFLNIKNEKRRLNQLEDKYREKCEIRKREMERTMEKYKQILTEITNFSQEDEIYKIADKFKLQEEDTFANCNNVIKLNREMELMCIELGNNNREIDKARKLAKIRRFKMQGKLIVLQDKLDQTVSKENELDKELKAKDVKLSSLTKEIDRIFKIVKCSKDSILELLGDNETVTPKNVVFYLRVIEDQCLNLITVFLKNQLKTKSGRSALHESPPKHILKTEEIVRSTPCPLCAQHEQVSDVIDELQIACTKKNIADKLKRRLALPDCKPDCAILVHSVSQCHLPESRQILQRRYQ